MGDNQQHLSLLEEKIKEVDGISQSHDLNRILQWKNEVLMILDNLISSNSKYYKQIDNLGFRSQIIVGSEDDNTEADEEAMEEDIKSAKSTLGSIIYGIKNNLIR